MADFCIADHFIVGKTPVPKPIWFERDTWAMRVQAIAPGIQLMQTMERWSCQRLAAPGIIGMCAPYDYLAGESCGAFVPGFNYLLDPQCRDEHLFYHSAEELGDSASVLAKGAQRALCLRKTYLYDRARSSWKAAAVRYLDDPLAKLVDVLLRCEDSLQGRVIEFISGLWTAEHRFVHTGRLCFSVKTPWDGHIEWEATGMHNVIDARWSGPCAGFLSLQAHQKPVRVALQSWPFHARD